ncbi:ferroxidase/laccase group [Phlebiopsis gigantea 11061_1 CR5-6]|uniref:laccase n=1 Tax=Phlebiopsis gigantea (strain 11061_1 CR5-6) TaxID=745531 RepID=A0A0C3S2Q0_PHLG1|nr:ferroxidase/laccase group [Phlebiopsis gigantea 11061_1 CR5-6]
MAAYALTRLRYVSLVLPILVIAMIFGLGVEGVHAIEILPRDTSSVSVKAPPSSSFFLNGLKGQRPTTRHYNFVVSEIPGAPDGFSKPMLVVNGQWPGPTIEANQGDRLVIKVTNHLSNRTSIHWHGLFQNGTNYYDGTAAVSECGIPPGQSLTYDFETAIFSGSTWWHSHFDTQYTDGISGALIVHPSDPAPKGFPTWDEELVVELSDVYHTFSAAIVEQYLTGTGPVQPLVLETPDSGAINGVGQYNGSTDYFDFELQPHKTYRLRLIHTGSAAQIRFSVDHHPLTLIEADGTLLEPYTVSGVTLLVAQRYSALITTNQTAGPYWMRMELISPSNVTGTTTDVRGVIRYGTKSKSLPPAGPDPGFPGTGLADMDTTKLTPAVPDIPPDRSRFYSVPFNIGGTPSGGTIATMNNVSWVPLVGTNTLLEIQQTNGNYAPEGPSTELGNQFIITEDTIQTIDLLLLNTGFGEHPFHLHGHRPWILGFGNGTFDGHDLNPPNPLKRDTFAVPSQGWLMLRYISDNPGPWTLHCHIAWHMAAGLLMQVNSLPSVSSKFHIPSDIVNQCKSY